MNRIFQSMAALAFLAVVTTAQDKAVTVVAVDEGQTITINGQKVDVPAGQPIRITIENGKIFVNGKATNISADKPMTLRTDSGKTVTVQPGLRISDKISHPGLLVDPKTHKTVTVVPQTKLRGLTGTDKVTTLRSSPLIVHDGTALRTYQGGTIVAPQHMDDKEVQELVKRIQELNKQLHELIQKKYGGKGGNFNFTMPEGAYKFDDKQHKELMDKMHKEFGPGSKFYQQFGDKGHMELMKEFGQGGFYRFDDKAHKEMMDKLHKELGDPKRFQMDEKAHRQMMEELQKNIGKTRQFHFNDKEHQKMMEKLHKEFGENSKFYYRFDQGSGKLTPMPFGQLKRKKGGKDELPPRFFDEPMFRTPDPKDWEDQGKSKVRRTQGGTPRAQALRADELARVWPLAGQTRSHDIEIARKEAAIGRTQALKGAELARKQAAVARTQALKEAEMARAEGAKIRTEALKATRAEGAKVRAEAIKELRSKVAVGSEGTRPRAEALKAIEREAALARTEFARERTRSGVDSAESKSLRERIAVLEAQIRALKEENRRLKESKTPPPPKVQIRSKRVR